MLPAPRVVDCLTGTAHLTVISADIECLAKITGWNFRFEFHQQQCEVLFATGRTRDAVITFLQIDLSAEPKSKEEMQWVIGKDVYAFRSNRYLRFPVDFGARCVDKLNEPGDAASDSAAHRDAATYYSSPLTLTDMLIMRSTVHAKMHRWEAALKDATDVCVVSFLILEINQFSAS